MNPNIVIPATVFFLMIGIWVSIERRSSFGTRIAVGLTSLTLCGLFAVVVASVEEAIIGRHASALIQVDEMLNRKELTRVEEALAAYRDIYDATNDPKAAVFAFHDALATWPGGE